MFVSGGVRAIGLATLTVCSVAPAWAAPQPAAQPFALAEMRGASALVDVNPAALAGTPVGARVTVEGFPLTATETVDLDLERFTVTRPDTQFVIGHDRTPFDFDTSRVVLLRGTVAGAPGTSVFLAVSPWGSMGRIDASAAGGGRWHVTSERPTAGGAAPRLRVTEAAAGGGVAPGAALCGVDFVEQPFASPPAAGAPPQSASAGATAEVTQQIELAIETDYELFSLFGTLEATGAYVTELYAAVSEIYLRDVNTRVVLTFVRLWDDPDDLFNVEDPLDEFVDYWNTFMGDVHRDAAQFASGKRDSPYGGVAYVQALCTDFAYSVVVYMIGQFTPLDEPPDVFGYDAKVTAHELGHNAGTFHTHDYGLDTCDDLLGDPQRGTIMSYCSQTRSGANANSDQRFHTVIQGVMRDFVFTADCIAEDCDGNGVDDAIDLDEGAEDANGDGILDVCQDCNDNGLLDPEEGLPDTNGNGIPDECDPDCNGNGVPDDLDIALGNDTDLHGNGIPDGCEEDCDGDGTSDYTEIMADMSLDIDRNARLDACQDCDGDGTPDLEALAGAHSTWVASSEAGAPLLQFHAVSGVRFNESTGGTLMSPQDLIITDAGRVLVSSAEDDRVAEYDADGTFVGDLVAAGSGGLDHPTGLLVSSAGTLLVASRDTDSVLEYDLGTGAPLGEFVASGAGGLFWPFGLASGPNGNLFVTSANAEVIEYDGATGALVGTFVSVADNGGLFDPRGLLFTPDDNLIVASYGTDQILEYDGTTGAFIDQWNHGGTDTVLTLDQPWTLRLGPDGDVYASRHQVQVGGQTAGAGQAGDDVAGLHINSTRIYIYDVDSGNFLRSYVTGHDTGLSFPTAFDFVPGDATDCNLNQVPDTCDIASGTSEDANGNGTPDECETGAGCPGDLDGDGVVGILDFLALLAAWGPNPGHPADLDGDGVVGILDFLALLAAWGPC